jgi:copper chaperone NosL
MSALRLTILLLLLAVPMLLAGCRDDNRGNEPPRITYGRDTCDRCGMIISDERFASGLVAPNGDQMIFDDLGEMILIVREEGLGDRRAWVHDFDTLEWVDATTAYYVSTDTLITPMAMGLLSFATREAADAYAGSQGAQVMDWSMLLEHWHLDMEGH